MKVEGHTQGAAPILTSRLFELLLRPAALVALGGEQHVAILVFFLTTRRMDQSPTLTRGRVLLPTLRAIGVAGVVVDLVSDAEKLHEPSCVSR